MLKVKIRTCQVKLKLDEEVWWINLKANASNELV